MAREVSVELYCSGRPETCLGCGGPITAGDVVVPTERGWLLCLNCGAGLLLGQALPAWPVGGPEPQPEEDTEAAWTEVVASPQRREAMRAHPGSWNGSSTHHPDHLDPRGQGISEVPVAAEPQPVRPVRPVFRGA